MTAVGSERADTYNIHARWCSGGCPRWIATGAPTCMPYPCRCAETKATAPDWVPPDQVTCWWRKKTTGALTSRCPCWGDDRDGKPDGCCAWHMASPRYLDDRTAAFLALIEAAPDDDDDGEVVQASKPVVDPLLWDVEDGEAWDDRRPRHKPHVRRWPPAELTCTCPTPWDVKKGPGAGTHCTDCHENFVNVGAASMHRRRWTDPCTPPHIVRDVDTGASLLQQGADGVWFINWAANAA